MHLYDPNRPEIIPGRKAIVRDLSAVPHVSAFPLENGLIRLSVFLNNYDAHGGYSYRHTELPADDLAAFFSHYQIDTEDALLLYFDWSPQEPVHNLRPSFSAIPIGRNKVLIENIDDLI